MSVRSKIITFKIPVKMLEEIDELVKLGKYSNRSEFIRTAIRELLKREIYGN